MRMACAYKEKKPNLVALHQSYAKTKQKLADTDIFLRSLSLKDDVLHVVQMGNYFHVCRKNQEAKEEQLTLFTIKGCFFPTSKVGYMNFGLFPKNAA